MLKLFVDDIRRITDDWVLARSVTEAVRLLDTMYFDVVSIDHDISCITNTAWHQCEHTSPETFETVARFIAAMPEDRRPGHVYIHTSNPTGRERMLKILTGKVAILEVDSSCGERWFNTAL